MVNRNAGKMLLVIMTVLLCQWLFAGMLAAEEPAKMVQGGVTLTVAESKRLIAKAVAQMPIVKNALANGLVIITKGTTNAYVAEEITGHKITFTEFTGGRITGQGPQALPKGKSAPHMVLEKGKAVDISLPDAVKKLKAGDVVLKGANALDYKNKLAAVDIMGSNGGTTGIAMPYIVGRKAYLVIPVGLEKLVAGDIVDLTVKMREPMESLGHGSLDVAPHGRDSNGAGGHQNADGSNRLSVQCGRCQRCRGRGMARYQRDQRAGLERLKADSVNQG